MTQSYSNKTTAEKAAHQEQDSQSASATSALPTEAAERQCCHQICWINPAASIGRARQSVAEALIWRGPLGEVWWRRLHLKEPDLWLKEYNVGPDASSACLWRYLDSFFMCVNHGLDAVEPYIAATRERLALYASGLQWNAGSDHSSGLQSVSLWDMHAESLLWSCEYVQQAVWLYGPGPCQLVPVFLSEVVGLTGRKGDLMTCLISDCWRISVAEDDKKISIMDLSVNFNCVCLISSSSRLNISAPRIIKRCLVKNLVIWNAFKILALGFDILSYTNYQYILPPSCLSWHCGGRADDRLHCFLVAGGLNNTECSTDLCM